MDPFFLEKVPAFAPRIIEYRWIATVLGDNQRIARRNFTIDWMDSVRSERLGMGRDIRLRINPPLPFRKGRGLR
jgi:hypothetical protein